MLRLRKYKTRLCKGIICLLYCLLYFNISVCEAQDFNFSQFYNNEFYYNPSMCGLKREMDINFSHRNLWLLQDYLKFWQMKFSIDFRLNPDNDKNSGFCMGFIADRDAEGDGTLETINLGTVISYRKNLGANNTFGVGFMPGLINKSINYSNLVFSDELDPVHGYMPDRMSSFDNMGYDKNTGFKFDMSFGVFYEYVFGSKESRPKYPYTAKLGFAGHHVSQPILSFSSAKYIYPVRTLMHLSLNIPVGKLNTENDKIILTPAIIAENQNPSLSFNHLTTLLIGSNINFTNGFLLGAWYKSWIHNAGELILNVGLKKACDDPFSGKKHSAISKTKSSFYSATISLGMPFSLLRSPIHASAEINLSYFLPLGSKKPKCTKGDKMMPDPNETTNTWYE